ncbi:unnamed protein product, partial [Didymodactylos carnosus]
MLAAVAVPVLLSIKDKATKTELLPGGVTKYTTMTQTNTTARVLAGVFTLGFTELMTHYTESYHYFYGNEYLGETKNQAADAANKKALEFCSQGEFEEAKKLFNAAYHTCVSGSSDERKFENSRDATNIAVEGQNLLNNGKFSEAQAKFQEAYNLSDVSEVYSKFSSCKNAAQIEAEKLAAEKLAAEKLAAEKLAAEKRAAEKLAAQKRAAEKLAAEKRAAEKLAAEKLAAEKLAAEKLAAEKLAAEKRAAEKLAAEKRAAEKLAAEKMAAEKLAAEKLAAEKLAAELVGG